jgi:hypothetical protein
VLEVIHTSPLVDKLDVYAGLGVPEVWIFKDGAFGIQVLDRTAGQSRAAERSAHVPELDLGLVARFAIREDTPQTLREYEAAIRA